MKNVRENIKNGTLKEYRDKFERDYYGKEN